MFDVDVRDTRDELDRKPAWQRLHHRRVATVELGSDNFQLVVAELTGDGRFDVVERVKERVQLGEAVFDTGRIAADAFERGLSAVTRLRDVMQRHAPEAVLAVATSAIREADNGRQFVRSATRASGVPVCIIDGLEEARLCSFGVQHGLSLRQRRMAMFDLSGGSTKVVLADDRGCALIVSLPLGVLRLRNGWPQHEPPSAADLRLVEERVANALEPTLAHVRSLGFNVVVFSSSATRAVQRLALAEPTASAVLRPLGPAIPALARSAVARLERRLSALDEAGRGALAERGSAGTDTLLTTATTVRVIMQRLNVEDALISRSGLHEGMIVDYMQKRSTSALARVASR